MHDIKSGLAVKHGMNAVLTFEVKDHFPPTKKQADDFIELVKGLAGSPLLFHCEYEHGRTSTFSCLAKMALGMTVDQAIADEKERFHYEFRHHAQEEQVSNSCTKRQKARGRCLTKQNICSSLKTS